MDWDRSEAWRWGRASGLGCLGRWVAGVDKGVPGWCSGWSGSVVGL